MESRNYNHLAIYWATALIGAVAFVSAGVMIEVPPGSMDLSVYRFAVAVALLAWAGITYAVASARRYIGEGVLVIGISIAAYFSLAIYDSSLGTREVIGAMTAVICGGLMYHKSSLAVLWAAMCAAGFISAAYAVQTPKFPPNTFAVITLVLATFMSFAMVYTIRSRNRVNRTAAITRAMFERSADALTWGHVSTGVEAMNSNAERLFETSDLDTLQSLVRQAFADADMASVTEQLADGGHINQTLLYRTASGGSFWGATNVARLTGEHADLAVMRISDVTELHEHTEALERARDIAESAMEVRTRFLANMSHEIRTPMNGVIGMTSLLLATRLNAEQTSYVETIRSSGEALLTIINEILDFSKIEAGQIELESQAFDVEQCVADALDIVSPIAAQKNLEVVLDLPPKHGGFARGDVQRLRQVLVNLLSNAIKFTEEGEITLQVRQVADDLEGRRSKLHFEVHDTGIGIPAHKLDHLFEAFAQADASTTRRFGGTGLGLSISKSLVELMGGEIRVRSTEGEGSVFGFFVDVERDQSKRASLSDFAGKRAAIIDDNATNRRVLSGLVAAWNIDTETFECPIDFLDAYDAHTFDLILTDMAMPEMDGAQMLSNLRARKGEDLPPTVLLTSLDRGEVDWGAFSAVIRKPIRPTDLHNAIASALGGTQQTPRLPDQLPLEPFELRDQTVLLAEDNPVNQAVARKMLQKLGVRVNTAANGREAIEMMSHQRYSVVFMDVQMPEIDGLEATRLMRLHEDLPQPYIIAMTANAMAEDREACLESGMNDFVPKPIRIQDVQEALKRAVSAGAFPGI